MEHFRPFFLIFYSFIACFALDKDEPCPRLETVLDKSVKIHYYGNKTLARDTLAFLYCDNHMDMFPKEFSFQESDFYLTCSKPGLMWKPEIIGEKPKCLKRCNVPVIEGYNFKEVFPDNQTDKTVKSGVTLTINCQKGHDLFQNDNGSLSKVDSEYVDMECKNGSWINNYNCLPTRSIYLIGMELYNDDGSVPDVVHITLKKGDESMVKERVCGNFKRGVLNLNHVSTTPLRNPTSHYINVVIGIKTGMQHPGKWTLERLVVIETVNTITYTSIQQHTSYSSGDKLDDVRINMTLAVKDWELEIKDESIEDSDPIMLFRMKLNIFMKNLYKWNHCFITFSGDYMHKTYSQMEVRLLFEICLRSEEWYPITVYETPTLMLCPQNAQNKERTGNLKFTLFTQLIATYRSDIELVPKNVTYTVRIESTIENVTDIGDSKLYMIVCDGQKSTGKMYFDKYDLLGGLPKTFQAQKVLKDAKTITVGIEGPENGMAKISAKYLTVSLWTGSSEKVYVYSNGKTLLVPYNDNITLPLTEGGCKYPDNAPRVKSYQRKQVYSPGDSLTVSDFECDQNTVLSSTEKMVCLLNGMWSETITCFADDMSVIDIWKQKFSDWSSSFAMWKSTTWNPYMIFATSGRRKCYLDECDSHGLK